jgi:hypothetical protein
MSQVKLRSGTGVFAILRAKRGSPGGCGVGMLDAVGAANG